MNGQTDRSGSTGMQWALAAASGLLVFLLSSYLRVADLGNIRGGEDLVQGIQDALRVPVVGMQVLAWIVAALLLHLAYPCLVLALNRRLFRSVPALQGSLAFAGAIVVFAWLLVIHLNSVIFPHSAQVDFLGVSSAPAFVMWLVLVFGFVLLPLAIIVAVAGWARDHRKAALLALGLVLFAAGVHWWSAQPRAGHFERPHLVLIGVDSVRPDLIGREIDGQVVAPVMSKFLADAIRFPDATTPFARTFPAWASILTARNPVESGIRANLQNVDASHKQQFLTHQLREAGFYTAYITDEVRFSNIDQSFGFDRVGGPPMGVLDFLLGHVADQPLFNLAVNVPLVERLFPWVSGNRAAAYAYLPGTFSRMVDRHHARVVRQGAGEPLFLAVHFCLPHWPYSHGDLSRLPELLPGRDERAGFSVNARYLSSVNAVDRQVRALLDSLGRLGILDNAIVVLLSDHGETLAADDLRLRHAVTGEERSEMHGHGVDVKSQGGHQVLLAFRDFRAAGNGQGAVHADVPADLIDIMPTVIAMAGLEIDTGDRSGMDLMTFPNDRVRVRETGLAPVALTGPEIDEAAMAREGVRFYRVTEQGRLVVREEVFRAAVANKSRAIHYGPHLAVVSGIRPLTGERDQTIVDLDDMLWWYRDEFPDPEHAGRLFEKFDQVFDGDF